VLTSVDPGSAADRAGLRPGDRLLEFGGHPLQEAEQFRIDVLAARSPAMVLADRSGQERPLTLLVELEGPPTRLGISWRQDDAEPGTVIVTRVFPGSPAQRRQVHTGDRIYAVAGREFADGEAFFKLVTSLPSPLALTLEREGQIETVTIDVPPPEEVLRL
jgi:S1-C subfamily serine protease